MVKVYIPSIPIVASNVDEVGRSFVSTSEDANVWGSWMVKTSAIGGIICILPMPATITFPMRLGALTIIMVSLIVESGTDKTSKSIILAGNSVGNGIANAGNSVGNGIANAGSGIGNGIAYAGSGIGLGFGLGLAAIALSNYWGMKNYSLAHKQQFVR